MQEVAEQSKSRVVANGETDLQGQKVGGRGDWRD